MLASCSEGAKVPDDSRTLTGPHLVVAPGTNLRSFTAAYSSACSINVGIAFDGTDLIITCYDRNSLDYVRTSNGTLVKTLNVTGAGVAALGAAAWDNSRGKLWICNNFNDVGLVDPATGAYTKQFTSAGCFDGLAFDGSDGTIWSSGDAASTTQHYTSTGTLLSSTSNSGKIGGCGNSGIAVGGAKLYLSNDGCQEIYEVAKDWSTSVLFASFPRRLEDSECDDVTFAAQSTGSIWSIDAYDRELNAYAIPQGACNFGGGGGGSHGPLVTYPGQAYPGHIVLCKNVNSPPSHYTYAITAVSGTVAGDVVQSSASLVPGQCRVIFSRPNPSATIVTLSVTESLPAGTAVGTITRQEMGGPPQVVPGPSSNVWVRANSTFGAVVTYNNQHSGS
jgi:hypothetical protein